MKIVRIEKARNIENKIIKSIADLSEKRGIPKTEFEWVLELCSDSRKPSAPFNFDGRAKVKYNAGNQHDPEDVLHPSLDLYVIIGHYDGSKPLPAKGCGACAGAEDYYSMKPAEMAEFQKKEPHLAAVCAGACEDVEKNLEKAVNLKREAALIKHREIRLLWGLYDHVNAKVQWKGMDTGTEKYRIAIEAQIDRFSKGHSPEIEVHGKSYDIRKGQDPEIITVNMTDHELASYAGDKFGKVGVNFEISQNRTDKLTKISIGSGDYAWRHRNERDSHGFTRSDTTFLIADDQETLMKEINQLACSRSFMIYLEDRENTVMGAVKNNDRLEFFKIIR